MLTPSILLSSIQTEIKNISIYIQTRFINIAILQYTLTYKYFVLQRLAEDQKHRHSISGEVYEKCLISNYLQCKSIHYLGTIVNLAQGRPGMAQMSLHTHRASSEHQLFVQQSMVNSDTKPLDSCACTFKECVYLYALSAICGLCYLTVCKAFQQASKLVSAKEITKEF